MTRVSPDWSEFRRGAIAALPIWLGVIPFSFAYALLARSSGLTVVETTAMSALVFAGSAQLAFANLVAESASALVILSTVFLLNLRHVLYGLSLNETYPQKTSPPRPVIAAILTDEAYGIAIRDARGRTGSPRFLFGAGLSIFIGFFGATLLAAVFGGALPDSERLGLEFVFPLSFLALLLPLLRHRADIVVAIFAGCLAIALSEVTSGGVTILLTTIFGAALGTAFTRTRAQQT